MPVDVVLTNPTLRTPSATSLWWMGAGCVVATVAYLIVAVIAYRQRPLPPPPPEVLECPEDAHRKPLLVLDPPKRRPRKLWRRRRRA